ncbi:MAG: DNA methyltransferase, partial [Terriglobia bacterium]
MGEIVIDARSSLVLASETTKREALEARLLGRQNGDDARPESRKVLLSWVRNSIIHGDCEPSLLDMPAESIGLIFTSPPYYNARPEYEDYFSYEEYLLKIRRVIHNCHRVLSEGRFFVINVSPVLQRRASRNEASKR